MNCAYLTDHIALLNLYAAYSHAVDDGDEAGFLNCFTPSAQVDMSSFTIARASAGEAFLEFADEHGMVRGHAALRKTVGFVKFHHMTANVWIKTIDGDHAVGSAYFVVFTRDEGKIEHYGRYEDKLTRCSDGAWRFAFRNERAFYERNHNLEFASSLSRTSK